MSGIFIFLSAIAAAGAVFFLFSWVTARKTLKTQTFVEQANAVIAEQDHAAQRKGPVKRLKLELLRRGWTDPVPVFLAMGFAYLLIAVVVRLFVGGVASLFLAVVLSVGAVVLVSGKLAARRRLLFRRQLLQALGMLAGQIESGSGPQRALEQVVPSMPDPLAAEFAAALSSASVTKDLVASFRELGDRYPSRAFSMFVAALEIDALQGGALAPALRRAAEVLQREFELTEEALAEVSQTKAEFYAIATIVGGIGVYMVFGSGDAVTASFRSGIGMTVLGVCAINYAIGVFRALRILNQAKGNVG